MVAFNIIFIYILVVYCGFLIICVFSQQAALNLQPPLEYSKEVNDYKNLIKTLVMGNMIFSFVFSNMLCLKVTYHG